MVSIIETARREYGLQRRIQSVLEPSDLDLYTTYQGPRSDYFVATHAGVPAGEEGSRRSPGPVRKRASSSECIVFDSSATATVRTGDHQPPWREKFHRKRAES